jgi:hypothetical protein
MLTLQVILYIVVGYTLIGNLIELFKQTPTLKEAGQTPLTRQNFSVIVFAAIGELIVIYLVLLAYKSWATDLDNHWLHGMIFLIGFVGRNVGAYCAAWAFWGAYTKLEARKSKKQIDKDKEAAL